MGGAAASELMTSLRPVLQDDSIATVVHDAHKVGQHPTSLIRSYRYTTKCSQCGSDGVEFSCF